MVPKQSGFGASLIEKTQCATPPPAELLLLLPVRTALTHRMSSSDQLSQSLLLFLTASTCITQRQVSFSNSATAFSGCLHGKTAAFVPAYCVNCDVSHHFCSAAEQEPQNS